MIDGKHIEPILNYVAAIILILFGASHAGFVFLADVGHSLHNPVFPFLTNREVFAAAAVWELGLGVVCMACAGRPISTITTFVFIGSIAWYRFAFYYTGGKYCGCVGLLARLLNLGKESGEAIPIVALAILAGTTIPWTLRQLRNRRVRLVKAAVLLAIAGGASDLQKAVAAEIITLTGGVINTEYNPFSGVPYPAQCSDSVFTVEKSDQKWRILMQSRRRENWRVELVHDGTTTYLTAPEGGVWHSGIAPKADSARLEVYPGDRYLEPVYDPLGLSILWIAFCLTPDSMKLDALDSRGIPLPWKYPRVSLGAYGYEWKALSSDDRKYIVSCDVVRNHLLDREHENEFVRLELNPPEKLETRNNYERQLAERKKIPDGFMLARYRVKEHIGGVSTKIPFIAELEIFRPRIRGQPFPYPLRTMSLRVVTASITDGHLAIAPKLSVAVSVHDYRFKQIKGKKIFKYAEYTLHPGENIRPADDRSLREKAAEHLKHGPDVYAYAPTPRHWLLWGVLLILMCPVFYVLKTRTRDAAASKETNKQGKEHEEKTTDS